MIELAPVVFAEAAADEVAARIVGHLADEVVALARAAIVRLELEREAIEVVLGGGLLRAGDPRLLGAIRPGWPGSGTESGCMRRARRPSWERRCTASTAWRRAARRRRGFARADGRSRRVTRRRAVSLLEASRG